MKFTALIAALLLFPITASAFIVGPNRDEIEEESITVSFNTDSEYHHVVAKNATTNTYIFKSGLLKGQRSEHDVGPLPQNGTPITVTVYAWNASAKKWDRSEINFISVRKPAPERIHYVTERCEIPTTVDNIKRTAGHGPGCGVACPTTHLAMPASAAAYIFDPLHDYDASGNDFVYVPVQNDMFNDTSVFYYSYLPKDVIEEFIRTEGERTTVIMDVKVACHLKDW